nr:XrtA/PEP-CTERM system TPR-repeat protein PrsT [Neptunicella marina]
MVSLMLLLAGCSKMTAEEHVANARQLVEKQDVKGAIIEYKNAIQLAPDNADSRYELGQLYMQTKEYSGAEKELSKALDLGYSASKVLPQLTIALEKTKADVALSNIELEKQQLSDDDAVQVAYFKLQSLLRLDKEPQAKQLIARIKLYKTDSYFKTLSLAYEKAIKKELDDSLALVNQVLTQSPTQPQALKQKALLLMQQGKLTEAADTYKTYLDYNPDEPEVMFVLAKLWMDSGNTENAEPIVDKLLKINAENATLNYYKAMAKFNQKDYKDALKFAEKAIAKDAASPSYRVLAGYAAYALDDFETAQKHLSFTASELPNNHPALKVLAASQLKLGENLKAADTLNQFDSLTENDLDLFTSTSYELLKQGRVKEAKQLIERSSAMGKTANELTQFGVLQLSVNDLTGIKKLEQAVEMDPSLNEAQSSLAVAYLNTNQIDKAQQLADKWRQAAPNNIKPLMLQGMIYSKQNALDKAREVYQQALKVEPDNLSPALLLIELDAAEGKTDKAITALNNMLDAHPDYMPAISRYFAIMRAQNRVDEGVKKLQKLHQNQPDNMQIRLVYASALLLQQDFSSVINLLEAVSTENTPPDLYYRLLGVSYIRTNDVEKADELYSKWLAAQPQNIQALSGKLSVLESKRQYQEGLDLVTQSIQTYGENTQLQVIKTLFLLRLSQYEEAQKSYDKLPEQILQRPLIRGFKAQLQLSRGDVSNALPNAQAAYDDKKTPFNLRMLVMCLDRTGQKDQADNLIDKHLQAYPADQLTKTMLAERQLSSSTEDAIQTYTELVEQNPKNFLALNNLAYLLLQKQQLDDAQKYADMATQLLPDNPDALDTLAQIQLAKGNNKQAIRNLAKATDTGQASQEVWLNYIEALLKDGQTELAKRKISDNDFNQPKSQERLKQIKQQYSL